jgi:hypothetical protein
MGPSGILVREPDNSATAEQTLQDEMVRRKIGRFKARPSDFSLDAIELMNEAITTGPASVSSLETSVTRQMFSTRSGSEKPRSLLSSCRKLSPSIRIAKVDFSGVNDHLKAHEISQLRV